MNFVLRPYQKDASDAALAYFKSKRDKHLKHCGGVIILPTGAGKSLVLADIAHRLGAPLLIFSPSKEILEQNYEKMEKIEKGISSMYSASVGQKKITTITFATIGSVNNHSHDFDVFKYVCIDECHLVNSEGGMYERFIHKREDRVVVGLTATPYRLDRNVLRFLTRTRPRIFGKVLYYCQVSELLSKGYLAELKYYDMTVINTDNIRSNSTGSEYDDRSVVAEYERSGFYEKLAQITLRVLHPKSGIPRKGILVFTSFRREADDLVQKLSLRGVRAAVVTGDTPKREREKIINDFKSGKIRVVANVGVFIVGFNYPELDTVILARPTKSLSIYYQAIGRCIRPSQGKRGWVIDLSGNYRRFGAVSDLKVGLEKEGTERWAIFSRGRQLTNTEM